MRITDRCPTGGHYVHPGMTCEQIGDRPWNPVTGYRTDAEFDANPPQFTGLLAQQHPTASEITDDQLDLLRADLAAAERLRTILVSALTVGATFTAERDRARATAVALENELTEGRDAIARVRALHAPWETAIGKFCPACCDGTYECSSTPWPCATIQALNGEGPDA